MRQSLARLEPKSKSREAHAGERRLVEGSRARNTKNSVRHRSGLDSGHPHGLGAASPLRLFCAAGRPV